jgi:hypothetical protein
MVASGWWDGPCERRDVLVLPTDQDGPVGVGEDVVSKLCIGIFWVGTDNPGVGSFADRKDRLVGAVGDGLGFGVSGWKEVIGAQGAARSGPTAGSKSTARAPERCHPRGVRESVFWFPVMSIPSEGPRFGVVSPGGFSACRMMKIRWGGPPPAPVMTARQYPRRMRQL